MFGERDLSEPLRYSALTMSVLVVGFLLAICVIFMCRIIRAARIFHQSVPVHVSIPAATIKRTTTI